MNDSILNIKMKDRFLIDSINFVSIIDNINKSIIILIIFTETFLELIDGWILGNIQKTYITISC